jgi:4'-phosphopantetheinyl transferase
MVVPGTDDTGWPALEPSASVAGRLFVLAVDLDRGSPDPALLSAEEHARAARLRDDHLRRRRLVAWTTLRRVLGRCLDRDPATVEILRDARGCPSLRDGEVSFSLSHSGGTALVALAPSGPVGVDVEAGTRLASVDELAARVFAATESAAFLALPSSQRRAAFLTAWTRKEAALKALGLGLPAGMEHVWIAGEPPRLIGDFSRLPGLAALQVEDLPPIANAAAALAHASGDRPLCRRWCD